ncbi:hypothetical protein N7523_010272 [Penicillium sp. IBT 18751x]|nr:hypothetical protein N7523_010221 [Penicillium sp. IBT 18751x]KAJ6105198.1 hypothetical protein N7523_010272 [Penicillium sp. IBT 18751x]
MPKAATLTRNPTVPASRAVRRSTGAGRTSGQPMQPLSADLGGAPQPMSRGTRPRQGLASRGPQTGVTNNQGDDFDVVHAPCKTIIAEAETTNERLTTRFNQQRREAQRLSSENTQLKAQVQQLSSEKQSALDEVRLWKQKFDDATYETRDRVPREEMQKLLKELHQSALVHAGQIASKYSESQHMTGFSELPRPNVMQDSWQAQHGAMDMLQNPVPPEHPGVMFPVGTDDLPNFNDYLADVPSA